jgi:hypothetical protein
VRISFLTTPSLYQPTLNHFLPVDFLYDDDNTTTTIQRPLAPSCFTLLHLIYCIIFIFLPACFLHTSLNFLGPYSLSIDTILHYCIIAASELFASLILEDLTAAFTERSATFQLTARLEMKMKIAQVSTWALCQYLITLLTLTYPGYCNAVQGKAMISAIGEKSCGTTGNGLAPLAGTLLTSTPRSS